MFTVQETQIIKTWANPHFDSTPCSPVQSNIIFLTDNELFLVLLETFISIAMTQNLSLDYGKWVKKIGKQKKNIFHGL